MVFTQGDVRDFDLTKTRSNKMRQSGRICVCTKRLKREEGTKHIERLSKI